MNLLSRWFRRSPAAPQWIEPTALAGHLEQSSPPLIVAAFNDARAKVNAHAETEMHKLTGGLALPGGMKLPF